MRVLVLLLGLAPLSCANAGARSELQLTPTQIGPVRVGMSEAEIGALGFDLVREAAEGEGGEFVRITVDLSDNQRVVADIYGDRADRLMTVSPSMTTVRGAHVGMTLAELRQLYPGAEVNIGNAEGNYFSLRIADGAFFEFDTSPLPETCFEYRGVCPDLSDQPSISYFLRDYRR